MFPLVAVFFVPYLLDGRKTQSVSNHYEPLWITTCDLLGSYLEANRLHRFFAATELRCDSRRLLLELHQPREVHAIVAFEPCEVDTPEGNTSPWRTVALFKGWFTVKQSCLCVKIVLKALFCWWSLKTPIQSNHQHFIPQNFGVECNPLLPWVYRTFHAGMGHDGTRCSAH